MSNKEYGLAIKEILSEADRSIHLAEMLHKESHLIQSRSQFKIAANALIDKATPQQLLELSDALRHLTMEIIKS